MKCINPYRILTVLLFISLIVTEYSCSYLEEIENQIPTCTITNPENDDEIEQGETVTISVDAEDIDGDITEVRFYIDGSGVGSSNSFPYNYEWDTSSEYLGDHIIKVKAMDNDGGSISDEITISISTGGSGGDDTFTDVRDGKEYKTVTIGNQIWFAENLNYETTNSWWYDNSSANGDVYGCLYTWEAALTACPGGWSLPSDDEWQTLEMALGMSQSEADGTGYRGTDEGEQMKSTSGWYNNGNGTNSSGLNALPGGARSSSGSFNRLGSRGYWWSSTENSGPGAWRRSLTYDNDRVGRYGYLKTDGFSVRCLKN